MSERSNSIKSRTNFSKRNVTFYQRSQANSKLWIETAASLWKNQTKISINWDNGRARDSLLLAQIAMLKGNPASKKWAKKAVMKVPKETTQLEIPLKFAVTMFVKNRERWNKIYACGLYRETASPLGLCPKLIIIRLLMGGKVRKKHL